MILVWLAAAAVAADCAPIDEPTFRSRVLESQAAVDRGDAALQAVVLDEVEAALPCLAFAPQPRLWADYLVSAAIRAFFEGGDWERPMAAALRIRPDIDRWVGGGHPLAKWQPPPAEAATGGAVPAGVELYVDGLRAETLPAASGMHLVQRRDGRWWATLVLVDAPVPTDWLTGPVERPPHLAMWATTGIAVQAGQAVQHAGWESDYIVNGARPRLDGMITARGAVTFWSPWGVEAAFDLPLTLLGFTGEARVHGIWSPGDVLVGFGGALVSVSAWEGRDEGELTSDRVLFAVPVPEAVLRLRGGRRRVIDGTLLAAWRPSIFKLGLEGGTTSRSTTRPWRWTAGIDVTSAVFEQDRHRAREVRVTEAMLTVGFGYAWGEF